MTQTKDLIGMCRIIDNSGQTIAEFNRGDDQKWYIWDADLAQLSEIELSSTGKGSKSLTVAGSTDADTDLERFSGTATAGTATTITLPTGATESSDAELFHIGSLIQLTGGTGAGQNQRITGYTVVGGGGSDRIATVAAFAPAPDDTTTYEINCTNFYADSQSAQISTQRGFVRKPLLGQNVLDGDTNLYPMRIRVHPRIIDVEGTRYPSILFRVDAVTESVSMPGYGRWEWLLNYKNIPSRGVTAPFLFNEFPHQTGREMTADISDVLISPAAGAAPAWLEFTVTMTSVENGTAVWGQAETMGVS